MSRPVNPVNRHPGFGLKPTSARDMRLGALVLAIIALNQIDDPMVGASLGQEMGYWVVRTGVFAVGLWCADWFVARQFAGRWERPRWLKPVVLVSLLAVLPLALAEILVEPHLPMRPEYVDDDLWAMSPVLAFLSEYATLLSIILPAHLLLWLIVERNTEVETAEVAPPPAFLAQTAAGSAEDVLALQAEEHYVRVFTSTGSELVHHRFRDAVAEMPEALGLQVHRSWWVAEQAVRSAKRGSRRWQLTLDSDVAVPVSDSYVQAVRERGWLKRKP
ncbi:MAG: LytTR family DNA-binding domain-containing protein [Pseudomonadota bacterium]